MNSRGHGLSRRRLHGESLEPRLMLYNTYVDLGDSTAKWPSNDVSYSYSNLLNGWAAGPTNAQLIGAVEEAMGAWSAVTPLRFYERVDSGPLPDNNDSDYNAIGRPWIRWGHHLIDGPQPPPPAPPNKLAHASPPDLFVEVPILAQGGLRGDVHFDNAETFSFNSYMETAIHELGHAIGMAHANGDVSGNPPMCPPPLPAIMDACAGSYSFSGSESAFLFQDDISGIRSIYGAGLGYVLNLGGILHIYGTGVSDSIAINVSGGMLTATSAQNGQFTRATAGINAINIHGLGGNDFIFVEDTAGIPVFAFGGAGDDRLYIQPVGINLDRANGPITFFGGMGNNVAELFDAGNPDADTYTITSTNVSRPSFGTNFSFTFDFLSQLSLKTGGAGNVVDVTSLDAGTSLHLNNGGGVDVLNFGGAIGNTSNVRGAVDVIANAGQWQINASNAARTSTDIVILDGDSSFGWVSGLSARRLTWQHTAVSAINVITGSAFDIVEIRKVSDALTVGSTGGNDEVTVGDPSNAMQSIGAPVTISTTAGLTELTLNDAGDTVGRNVNLTSVGAYTEVIGMAPAIVRYRNTGLVALELGHGNDSLALNALSFYDNSLFNLRDHGGNDLVTVDDFALVSDGITRYEFRPAGIDLFQGVFTPPIGLSEILARRISFPATLDGDVVELVTVNMSSTTGSSPTAIVYGAPPGVGETYLKTGTRSNRVTVIPHDASGNSTLQSSFRIFGEGGNDRLIVDDRASAVPTGYRLYNPLPGNVASIGGLGAGLLSLDSAVQTLEIYAGAGNDTFQIDSFRTGQAVGIAAGAGDDVFEWTPDSRDLLPNITNMASFNYDGGDGYDSYYLHNDNSTNSWQYTRTASQLAMTRSGGGAYLFNDFHVEYFNVAGGTGADQFLVRTTAAGSISDFDGLGSNDYYELGQAQSTDGILGAVYLSNSLGIDSVVIDDRSNMTGKTLHVDEYFVGGAPGDNLFGPGSFLYHVNITGTMTVKLGSGDDTVYVAPDSTTELIIEGNGNTLRESGDFLGLALAAAINPVFTPGTSGDGVYSFDNLAAVNYFDCEVTQVDDVGPQIVDQSYNESGVSAIVIEFSEDVSQALDTGYLTVIDTASNQALSQGLMALSYDAGTNIANFTFPGLPNGRLPEGDYVATIAGSLPDLFGNLLVTETPLFFYASGSNVVGDFDGDLDLDADDIDALVMAIVNGGAPSEFDLTGDGLLDLTDRDEWLALAGAANLPSGNPYLLGDANLDAVVDGQDFIIWNGNKFTSTGKWTEADWNADGVTDGLDFIIWNVNKFTAVASSLASEAFDYADGSLFGRSGGTGWSSIWTGSGLDVVSGRAVGNLVGNPPKYGVRNFDNPQTTSNLFVSLDLTTTTFGTDDYFGALTGAGVNTSQIQFGKFPGSNEFQVGNGGFSSSNITIVPNTTYHLIGAYAIVPGPDPDLLMLWVNPTANDYFDPSTLAHSADVFRTELVPSHAQFIDIFTGLPGIAFDNLVISNNPVGVNLRRAAPVVEGRPGVVAKDLTTLPLVPMLTQGDHRSNVNVNELRRDEWIIRTREHVFAAADQGNRGALHVECIAVRAEDDGSNGNEVTTARPLATPSFVDSGIVTSDSTIELVRPQLFDSIMKHPLRDLDHAFATNEW